MHTAIENSTYQPREKKYLICLWWRYMILYNNKLCKLCILENAYLCFTCLFLSFLSLVPVSGQWSCWSAVFYCIVSYINPSTFIIDSCFLKFFLFFALVVWSRGKRCIYNLSRTFRTCEANTVDVSFELLQVDQCCKKKKKMCAGKRILEGWFCEKKEPDEEAMTRFGEYDRYNMDNKRRIGLGFWSV